MPKRAKGVTDPRDLPELTDAPDPLKAGASLQELEGTGRVIPTPDNLTVQNLEAPAPVGMALERSIPSVIWMKTFETCLNNALNGQSLLSWSNAAGRRMLPEVIDSAFMVADMVEAKYSETYSD